MKKKLALIVSVLLVISLAAVPVFAGAEEGAEPQDAAAAEAAVVEVTGGQIIGL